MNLKYFSKFLLIVLVVTFFAGCDLFKDDENPPPVDNYLVSYEKHKTYLPSFIVTLIENFLPDYPEFQDIIDNFEHGIAVYSISFKTQYKGEEIVASGLVSVPITPGISFPLLSFQNGTNTLHSEAPSVNPDNQLYLLLEFIASTGFVVAFPDYLGFGASEQMFHPYLDKESTVQTVIDMLRAVNELVNNHLEIEINEDLYITGYSQGGWATMQTQKAIEDNYSSEFNLVASACGAGPYNLNYINSYILELDQYPMPYYVGYIYNSLILTETISTPVAEVFKSPYDEKILSLYDGTRSGEQINAQLTTNVSDLFTEDYINNYNTSQKFASIITGMTQNSITAWKTTTPTRIFHGLEDDFVPPEVSQNIYLDFLSKGVQPTDVIYVPIPGAGHQDGVIPAQLATFKWFIDLKNGM